MFENFEIWWVTGALLLYGAIAVLKVGNDVLSKEEHVAVDRITGHGAYFTTPVVGQKMLAPALNSSIGVLETADLAGFDKYQENYQRGWAIKQAVVENKK